MLILRIGSAVVFAPLVWLAVWHGGWPLELMVLGLVALMVREVLPMVRVAPATPLGLATVATSLIACLGALGRLPAGLAAGGWAAALAIVPLVAALSEADGLATSVPRAAQASWASAYCGLLLPQLVVLRRLDGGMGLALLVLAAVWAADSGAYFAGRLVGRRPLAPRVSPNKTLEGAWGGMAAAVAAAWAVASLFAVPLSGRQVVSLAVVVAVVGTLGDLCESALKRASGVKDSARLIPGHGGVLDRFDALMFAAPAALVYVALLPGRSS